MKRKRKNYTAPEKVALLKRHLADQVPVSTICDEAQLQPTVFDRWLKQFFENGAAALERATSEADRATIHAQRRVQVLEERLGPRTWSSPSSSPQANESAGGARGRAGA